MEIRIVTDESSEGFALSGDGLFAVPAEVTVPEGSGCAVITVFPSLSAPAERAAGNCDDPLGEGLLFALAAAADPFMKKAGYTAPPEVFRTVGFVSPDGYDGEVSLPCGASVEVKDEGGVPVVSVIAGSAEVSRSSVNDITEEDGVFEIYVETEADHRSLGYATACVTRLTRILAEQGKKVRYVCGDGNLPSLRVAEKAGLLPEYRSAAIVYYRPDGRTGGDVDGV